MHLSHPENLDDLAMILRWRNRQPSNSSYFILMMSTLLLMRPAASLRGTTRFILIQMIQGDDPGGGSTNDWGFFSNCTTSASTFSKASASYAFSSLTTRVSLLSLSDKSTADMVKCANVDYATESFCFSCSVSPHMARGLWSSGKGFAMCHYDDNCGG